MHEYEHRPAASEPARATPGAHPPAHRPRAAAVQRSVGNSGIAAAMAEQDRSPVHDVISSGGRPLEAGVRADMEGRFGQDFGDVRVHDDATAGDSAGAVGASAYTVGADIVFQRYDPSSAEGRITLAHELTHVVQQRQGPVDGTPAAGGIRVSDPSDRFEREASATARELIGAPEVQRQAPDELEDDELTGQS
jgi:hypothetical protein